MNTKAVGEISEAQVLAALLRSNKVILLPFGDNQRYDFVIDDDGNFFRVQCKTGRIKNGAVVFPVCSSSVHRGGEKKVYINEIEYFGIYCPDNKSCYLVPISAVQDLKHEAALRIDEPKNGQLSGIKWAKDFVLG